MYVRGLGSQTSKARVRDAAEGSSNETCNTAGVNSLNQSSSTAGFRDLETLRRVAERIQRNSQCSNNKPLLNICLAGGAYGMAQPCGGTRPSEGSAVFDFISPKPLAPKTKPCDNRDFPLWIVSLFWRSSLVHARFMDWFQVSSCSHSLQ